MGAIRTMRRRASCATALGALALFRPLKLACLVLPSAGERKPEVLCSGGILAGRDLGERFGEKSSAPDELKHRISSASSPPELSARIALGCMRPSGGVVPADGGDSRERRGERWRLIGEVGDAKTLYSPRNRAGTGGEADRIDGLCLYDGDGTGWASVLRWPTSIRCIVGKSW